LLVPLFLETGVQGRSPWPFERACATYSSTNPTNLSFSPDAANCRQGIADLRQNQCSDADAGCPQACRYGGLFAGRKPRRGVPPDGKPLLGVPPDGKPLLGVPPYSRLSVKPPAGAPRKDTPLVNALVRPRTNPRCLRRPSRGVKAGCRASVKGRIRPLADPLGMPVFHWVVVNVIHMPRIVAVVSNGVLPESPLPDAALAPAGANGRPLLGRLYGSDKAD